METAKVVRALLGASNFALGAAREVYRGLDTNKLLAFDYDEGLRVVEVHSFGITKKGALAVRAYQVNGESSQPLPGWRMFSLEKIRGARTLITDSKAPREGFKANDKHLETILLEILK